MHTSKRTPLSLVLATTAALVAAPFSALPAGAQAMRLGAAAGADIRDTRAAPQEVQYRHGPGRPGPKPHYGKPKPRWQGRPGWHGRPGWQGRPGWRAHRGYYGPPRWGNRGWGYYDNTGAWVAAAIGAAALGAVAAGAANANANSDAVAYCMRRFKSYDPRSGTYLGYDGYRHPCP